MFRKKLNFNSTLRDDSDDEINDSKNELSVMSARIEYDNMFDDDLDDYYFDVE